MKNAIALVLVFLIALFSWQMLTDPAHLLINVNGDEFDGPADTVLGLAFGGLGLVIALVVMLAVAALLGAVFAGVGVVMVAALGLTAVVALAVLAPLMLPVLLPVAIILLVTRRARRR